MERIQGEDFLINDVPHDTSTAIFDQMILSKPFIMILLMALQGIIILGIAPQLKNLKLNLKPYLLIFNGFMFGSYGVSLIVFLGAFKFEKSWSCDGDVDPFRKVTGVYMSQVLIVMKMIDNISPMVMMIQNRSKVHAFCSFIHLNNIAWVIWFILKLDQVKPSFFILPSCDLLRMTLKYQYHVLITPDNGKSKYRWLRHVIYFISLALAALNLYHLGFLINCDCPSISKPLLYSAFALIACETVYLTNRLYGPKLKVL